MRRTRSTTLAALAVLALSAGVAAQQTVQDRTTAPPPSVMRVTSAPVSAFVAVRLTVSRTPSPLGENQVFASAPGNRSLRSGALVSTTSVRDALAGPLSHASLPVTLTV